jgi:hypothetical protein
MSNSPTPKRRSLRVIVLAVLGVLALMLAAPVSASAAPQYWLNNSQMNPTTHCYTGYGPSSYRDLLPTPPLGATSSSFAGQTLFGCTPAFPAGAQLGAGSGSIEVWFTNPGKKTCNTTWFLMHNATPTHAGQLIAGSTYNGGPLITVPAHTTTPTRFTVNFAVPATTLPPGDQLMLQFNVRTRSGACSAMTLYYGSTAHPTNLSLPTLVG